MSPEQAKGEPVGPQSDLYSLGVVLYEMLTGNLPYEADSALGQAMKHIIEPPPSPRGANPEVSEALDALTTKLLAKNPEDRCSSAAALADELVRVRSGALAVAGTEPEAMTELLPPSPRGRTRRADVQQPPVAAPARAPERGGQRRGRLFSALAALLLAGTVLGGLIWALHSFGLLGSEASKNQADAEDANPIVQVPDLYWSMTAESDLANVGLALGDRNVETSDAVPANVVIRSAPEEGDEVERDTIVDIWVSTGPVRPPTQVPSDPQPPPAQPPPAQPPQPQFVQPTQPQTKGDDGEKEAQNKINNKQKGNAKQKGDEGD
jgi:serine/threonine-protein kinase